MISPVSELSPCNLSICPSLSVYFNPSFFSDIWTFIARYYDVGRPIVDSSRWSIAKASPGIGEIFDREWNYLFTRDFSRSTFRLVGFLLLSGYNLFQFIYHARGYSTYFPLFCLWVILIYLSRFNLFVNRWITLYILEYFQNLVKEKIEDVSSENRFDYLLLNVVLEKSFSAWIKYKARSREMIYINIS